jgi:UDP-N-acetylglucosamine 2-epimerase
MDKKKWSRVSVVLDKKTGDEIRYVSAVTGTPVSEIVRDVLADPVAHLAGTLRTLQADPSPESLKRLLDSTTATVDTAHAEFHRRHG